MEIKDTYKFQLKMGRKVILRDITCDLDEAIKKYLEQYPKAKLLKIGRKTTNGAALKWLNSGGKREYVKVKNKNNFKDEVQ